MGSSPSSKSSTKQSTTAKLNQKTIDSSKLLVNADKTFLDQSITDNSQTYLDKTITDLSQTSTYINTDKIVNLQSLQTLSNTSTDTGASVTFRGSGNILNTTYAGRVGTNISGTSGSQTGADIGGTSAGSTSGTTGLTRGSSQFGDTSARGSDITFGTTALDASKTLGTGQFRSDQNPNASSQATATPPPSLLGEALGGIGGLGAALGGGYGISKLAGYIPYIAVALVVIFAIIIIVTML